MNLKLPSSVWSQQDLKAVILEVRRYASWYGQVSVKQRFSTNSSFEPLAILPDAVTLIKQWTEDNPISKKSLDGLIQALKDIESTTPHLTITLAAPAPNKLKDTLITWCREHINPNVLINFKFNSTILGGMVISYGSHTYDWSFRRQILASLDKFPEVLRHV